MSALLGSLTIGAVLILWLEPRPTGLAAGGSATLMASTKQRVEFATIEYLPPGKHDVAPYDCVIRADGVAWTLRESNTNARLAVLGVGGGTLSDGHRRQLLTGIGHLTRLGLSPNKIRLAAGLRTDGAPLANPEAADLVEFLRAKSFVR